MTSPGRENLVIGGGLAGTMTALGLRSAGRDVLLLEKERGAHHKVCGEFLSPEAVRYLRVAGIDPVRLGAAEIDRLRFSAKGCVVESGLPFQALSLSRHVLDAAMLDRAEEAGCEVSRGRAVQALRQGPDGWHAELGEGRTERARNLFLATGKHDLRGWPRAPGKQNELVGFKMHWRLRPDQMAGLRGFMDLFLFQGGYGGLALVEGDAGNLCFVIRRSRLRRTGGWEELIPALCEENELLAERLGGAQPLWERPLAISSIPYGYLPENESGAWRVGDQAAVIPSFTGDGMAIALHSGALAAEMYLAGQDPNAYHRALRKQLRRGMCVATLLSRAMVSRAGRMAAPAVIPLLRQPIGWIARITRIPRTDFCAATSLGAEAR